VRSLRLRMRPEIANRPLLVTTSWDDGHPSDLRVADLLERHGLQGTFYIPSQNSEGRPVMHPTEIAQLARRFEIGGHTHTHISLTGIEPHLAAEQILANKNWLEDLLGRPVRGFAYVRGHHNRIVRDLVARAGYRYARTVKTLTSVPGSNLFEVSTTSQFFAHSRKTYIRNYISGRPTLKRSAVLAAVLSNNGLATRLSKAAEVCASTGGHFHLWGHSWELDQHGLWDELDRLFSRLHQFNARFVTNDAWCENLPTGSVAQTHVIADPAADLLGRSRASTSPPSRCML
jgi:peptidoglycan/xylan/chitin deacetylase (PgdA/CDA1 family)